MKILSKIYYDPAHPASYGSAKTLWKAAGKKISLKRVQDWLAAQDAYTLHKPARKTFTRNRIYVATIDEQWQADLNDMISIQKHNKGFRYILTVIDCFSKYSWAIPLKTKTSQDIIQGFATIFKQRKPIKLQTDKGKEFVNAPFQKYLKKMNVKFFTSNNPDIKCAMVERLNRTLKTKMWKYFTAKNTRRYIDVLPKLLQAYNSSTHSSIKMAPANVNKKNVTQVWNTLYGVQVPQREIEFKVGDTVRISKTKMTFDKGYIPNWTEEVFKVTGIQDRIPKVYTLEDLNGEPIEGTFYAKELQKVRLEPGRIYKIDKIVDTRQQGPRTEVLVKWKGYPSSFNSWIPEEDVQRV